MRQAGDVLRGVKQDVFLMNRSWIGAGPDPSRVCTRSGAVREDEEWPPRLGQGDDLGVFGRSTDMSISTSRIEWCLQCAAMKPDTIRSGRRHHTAPAESDAPLSKVFKNILIGKSRSPKDQTIFHRLSLVAFCAWAGLGADGLPPSCYGPQEAFLTLGNYPYSGLHGYPEVLRGGLDHPCDTANTRGYGTTFCSFEVNPLDGNPARKTVGASDAVQSSVDQRISLLLGHHFLCPYGPEAGPVDIRRARFFSRDHLCHDTVNYTNVG